ncbi:extracellular solute-binding protein [Cohnella sp.]|uniref:extracellular solute-binding protein n=1 Tax=Cohnella sp. TaxID=1883426 RepID=UPI00356820C6
MKRLLTLMIMMVVLVTAACTNGNNQQNAEGSSTEVDTNTNSDTEDFGQTTGAEKPITIQFGSAIDVNAGFAVDLKEATGETWEDNRWTRLYKEKLNVETKYKLHVPAGQYSQKLKLAIASNDLPDMFSVPVANLTDLKQLAEGGAIQEMGSIYEEYASPLLRSIIEAEGASVFDPLTFNGKIYGVPIKMPSTNEYNHLWVRQDWLDKLGLERPKTMNDVYTIAKAFAEQDPDGNGRKDTIGLSINKDFMDVPTGMAGLFWGYGAFPEFWYKGEDGKITNGSIQPEMKEALRLLAKMYQQGLLDKEFGTKDYVKASELMASGKAGLFYGPHWAAGTANNSRQNDPKANWAVVPLPVVEGVDLEIPLKISTDGAYVVRAGFEHPEKLVEMMNHYVEMLFAEGADLSKWWTEGDIDAVWLMSPVYTLKPTVDLEAHTNMKEAIANGTTDQLTGVAKGFYDSIQKGAWNMEMMFGPKDTPFEFVASTYPDKILWSEWQNAPTPTQVTAGSSIQELVNTSLTGIIMGKVDVDTGFDNFVKNWNKIGGEQIIKEINEARVNQ